MIDTVIFEGIVSGDPENILAMIERRTPASIGIRVANNRGMHEIYFSSKALDNCRLRLQKPFGRGVIEPQTVDTCRLQIAFDSRAADPNTYSAKENMQDVSDSLLRVLRLPELPTTQATDATPAQTQSPEVVPDRDIQNPTPKGATQVRQVIADQKRETIILIIVTIILVIIALLACIGTYLAVPQVQGIIQFFLHGATPTLTPMLAPPTATP